MSSKKKKNIKKNLLHTEHARGHILSELLSGTMILRGSYARIYTKCGKDNCCCKDAKGHPHSRITWREEGEGFTRKVPSDKIPWVREVTENYRKFRSLRRELVRLQVKSKKLLDEFENDLIQSTRKGINFLGVNVRNRRKKSRIVSKKNTPQKRGKT